MANNIKYRQIKAFCLAAQEGSFIAAARLLHVSQPSFTALIKGLEDDLGMLLFERSTRQCRLTAQGESLYEPLNRTLADLEEAYQYAKDEGKGLRGRLTLASLPSLSVEFLASAVATFHQRYPAVRVFVTDLNSDEVVDAVRSNRVELGVGPQPVDQHLGFQPLFTDHLLVAGVPDHPFFRESRIHWETLARYEICLIGGGATAYQMDRASPGRLACVEVTHLATAISIARIGMLLAIIPSSAVAALNTEGLRFEPIRGQGTRRRLGALFKRQRPLSSAARHFLDLLRQSPPPSPTRRV